MNDCSENKPTGVESEGAKCDQIPEVTQRDRVETNSDQPLIDALKRFQAVRQLCDVLITSALAAADVSDPPPIDLNQFSETRRSAARLVQEIAILKGTCRSEMDTLESKNNPRLDLERICALVDEFSKSAAECSVTLHGLWKEASQLAGENDEVAERYYRRADLPVEDIYAELEELSATLAQYGIKVGEGGH